MDDIGNKNVRQVVFNKYNGHCAYCGCKLHQNNFTIDHIDPKRRKSKGIHGLDKIENYNPSCNSCNSTKSVFTIEKFRERLIEDVNRLRKYSSKYRILERFGILAQVKFELKFYFETHGTTN